MVETGSRHAQDHAGQHAFHFGGLSGSARRTGVKTALYFRREFREQFWDLEDCGCILAMTAGGAKSEVEGESAEKPWGASGVHLNLSSLQRESYAT